MSRPVNANAEHTRAELLRTATLHFGRDGFHRATTRRIAADVGVSFATLHHYFGKKDALYGECIKGCLAELMALGVALATELATPPTSDRIDRAVRLGFRRMQANPDRSRFLLRAFVFEDPELVSTYLSGQRNPLLEGALRLLAGGDDEAAARRKVRLIGLGMLLTRFVSASHFERGALGDSAFDENGLIEEYLVDMAKKSFEDEVDSFAALAKISSS